MHRDKNTELLEGSVSRIFLRFALPSIGSAAVMLLFGIFDAMFIGQNVGELGLAALNISVPVFSFQIAPGLILGIGGATLGAIAAGAGRAEEQNKYFTLMAAIGLIFSVLEAMLGMIFIRDIAGFLGASGKVLELSVDYLTPIIIASPCYVMHTLVLSFVRNDNDPKLAAMSVILCSLLNILLDYLAVVVFDWGMWGAAAATSLSMTVGLIVALLHFGKKSNTLRIARPDGALLRLGRALKCGLPPCIVELAGGVATFLFNNRLMHYVGERGVAAYSVCITCVWLTTAISSGIGNGVQPIISTNFGAGQLARVKKTRNLALITASALCIAVVAACQIFPKQIVLFFVDADAELLALGIRAVRIYSLSMLFVGATIVLGCYMQAANFSLAATLVQLARGIVFSAILVFILPPIFGTDGIWMSVIFAELLSLALAVILARRTAPKLELAAGKYKDAAELV